MPNKFVAFGSPLQVLDGLGPGEPASPSLDGTSLSMALWARAVLRRPPPAAWYDAWWRAAADPWVVDTWDATSIAKAMWAAAELRTRYPTTTTTTATQGTDVFSSSSTTNSSASDGGSGGGGEGRLVPPAEGIAALLLRCSHVLGGASMTDLATLVGALAELQYR